MGAMAVAEKQSLVEELTRIVGGDAIYYAPEEMLVYENDGYTLDKAIPDVVVLPTSTEQVAEVVKLCRSRSIPFVGRGAGTGLSGGCLALKGGVTIQLSRMQRILEVDYRNRVALVEAGVVNLRLTEAVQDKGYHFAPDPSSQPSCTIGGNIAENSGGPHTLKYGVTTNHVLGLELVLPSGEVVWLGGKTEGLQGYDLVGVVTGSEGTFGIITKAWVKLTRLPRAKKTMLAVFDTVDDATNTVSGIIARGIIPAAIEMIDNVALEAVEAAFKLGFPLDAGALLLVEVDGLAPSLERQAELVQQVFRENKAREVRVAKDEKERTAVWTARKRAFGALGRITPSYCTQDGVIPRTKLPEFLRIIAKVSEKYGLRVANIFHAGDGNLHPCILYDERKPDEVEKVFGASREILTACVEAGGSVTGEHGIGIEKVDFMPLMFSEVDLDVMGKLKEVFNPDDLCNPDKVFPTNKGCIERRERYIKGARPGRKAAL